MRGEKFDFVAREKADAGKPMTRDSIVSGPARQHESSISSAFDCISEGWLAEP